ncbi:MAG: cyclic nucleotide-binding domain-containing protein [Proteobacteria bacterium]|nr:cyclic nucleotide-binding domain-containing protein [Pseudomonadota bacterium]MBU1688591.1 cyclic nucleotide-binding domain-containing protein [Pseudomonadota bacterium]
MNLLPQEIEAFLPSVRVFSELDSDTIRMLAGYVMVEHCAKGEVILEQGVQGEHLWLIHQGSVKVFQEVRGKEIRALATLGPGDIFGEISIISKSPTTAEVRSGEDCVLLKIPHEVISFVIQKNLTTSSFFSRTFVERLSDSARKLVNEN